MATREPEGERKQLTVLFADVQGSMELQEELDVEAWAGIVDRFVNILADGVRRFGGTVDKFTGDGIMALFGAPEAQEDHARRACHSAWHLTRAIRTFADELRQAQAVDLHVRIGLNSGEVVVGQVGEALRLDPTALGHTVGLAQRMEALAVAGSAYLTEHTARLVEGWFRLRNLGPMTVKGAREKLGVYVLEGPAPPRISSRTRREGSISRLVGRAAEMAILEDALGRADEGRAQVVGVVGEPGVGKSRLCDEFVRSALARGISVRRTAGVSHGREVPLLPILAYFRDYFGITDDISPSQARERISDRMLGLDAGFLPDLPLFFDFLEVPDPERPASPMAAEVRMRRIFEVLRRVTARRSERELAVLVWEDLHWFDRQSEAFLERLVENFPGSRTLVVTNFRPEFSASWMRHSYYRQIPLLPLSADAVTEMLGELVGDDASLAPLPHYLVERTGGNPFFVEEVVRALAEDGTLEGRAGAYRLTRPLEKAGLPPSVQSVLAARIDRLAAEHKPVLQSAAVIGRSFAEAVLARVAGKAVEVLAESLSALCAAELLQEAQRYPVAEYRFWHALTQEVAYGTLLAGRRARLHAAVAEALIECDTDRLDEEAAVIAWHWQRAGRRLEAAQWSVRAAEFALRSDVAEAMRRWRLALEHLDGLPQVEASLRLAVRVRTQLIRIGARAGLPAAETRMSYRLCREGAERVGDHALLAMVEFSHGFDLYARGELGESWRTFLEAARLGATSGDAQVMAVTCVPSLLATYVGPLSEGLHLADCIDVVCSGDPEVGAQYLGYSPVIRTLHYKAELGALAGRIADARPGAELALQKARDRAEAEGAAWALAFMARLADLSGEDFDALGKATEAVRIANESGNHFLRVIALLALGSAQLDAGQYREADETLRRGLAEARDRQAGLAEEARLLLNLARALLGQGRNAAARATADDAVAIARRQGARVVECSALIARAKILVATEGTDAAEAAMSDLEAAHSLVEQTGAVTYEPFIREEVARLREDEQELREVRHLYAQIGATGHVRRLDAELTGLH